MSIDCHVLTLPPDHLPWLKRLLSDLESEPVNVHVMPGILNDVGSARARAFAVGDAPYVSFCDSDDRIACGVFATLRAALDLNPASPFAWAGERIICQHGTPGKIPDRIPTEYDPKKHAESRMHVHGVVLMRRELVMPELPALCGIKSGDIWCLTLRLARHGDPIPVPIVGRHWRRHPTQNSRRATAADIALAAARADLTATDRINGFRE